jgi:hypothetical protein
MASRQEKTKSAKLIAERSFVAIYPADDRGTVLWDPA